MKKFKKIGYIFLFIVIVALSFTIYATVSKDTEKINKDKRIAELEYFESEILDIFNALNNKNINWDNIKKEVETLYTSIPIITLDFYQSNIKQEDILNFNKEFDNLTVAIKQEDKQNTLLVLSKLYDYVPKFSQEIFDEEFKKVTIETKANILKAYSKIDSKNWEEISNDIKQASNVYSKLLTDTNIDQSKQYIISKMYVMINELQNAVQIQNEAVFLIKYKNLIEEINAFK